MAQRNKIYPPLATQAELSIVLVLGFADDKKNIEHPRTYPLTCLPHCGFFITQLIQLTIVSCASECPSRIYSNPIDSRHHSICALSCRVLHEAIN